MKRPLSHVCAMFVYALFIIVAAMLFLHGVRDVMMEALALVCVVQLLGALVAPRERRQYAIGVVALTLIAMDAAYGTVVWPAYQLLHQLPGTRATWPQVIVNAVVAAALFLLPYAYAFGADSRQFFNLPPLKKK